MKTCTACGTAKDVSEFYRRKKNRDGFEGRCKKCSNASATASHQRKAEETAQYLATWRANNQRRSRGYSLKRHYGIDHDEFDRMLVAQGSTCAICRATEPGGRGSFHVDHDHKTGRVRGLLCHQCNVAIGQMHDDPNLLLAGAAYLFQFENVLSSEDLGC